MTGEVVTGEVMGRLFVHEKDIYTGESDVYEIGEEVNVVTEENEDMEFPTELDNAFSDADLAAREGIAEDIQEAEEAAAVAVNFATFLEATQEYVDLVNRAMEAYATAERDRDHVTAMLDMNEA